MTFDGDILSTVSADAAAGRGAPRPRAGASPTRDPSITGILGSG